LSPKKQDEVAKNFRTRRNAGLTDAYGNPKTGGGGGGNNNNNNTQMASGVVTNTGTVAAPTNAEVAQAQSTTMSADEILLANNKKGKKDTIMTSASGLGESNILNTKKKTLGA